jgi:hypothetical protein
LVGSPVFNDESGTRVSAIRWGSRIFLVLVVLLAAALVLTLRSHVSVPGLERLGPGLEAREVRPVVRTGPSNPPAEQAKVASDVSTFRAEPTPRPTTGRAGVPSTGAARPAEARRAGGPSTDPTVARVTADPSSAPTAARTKAASTASARPTRASPTGRAGGPGTEKPRNPKAATPSRHNEPAPGQTRRPRPKPTTDLG